MIRLGSNSKTRAKILEQHNIKFIQNGGNFNEDLITSKVPKEFVIKATLGKYNELHNKYGSNEYPLLVADSVVSVNEQLLRKAKDKNHAKEMLKLQSGNKTSIITCMIFKSKETYLFDVSETTYQFNNFDKQDMEEYIESGECMGKAGAIMVEGFCKPYIQSVEGYESTAMGLCIEKLLPFL